MSISLINNIEQYKDIIQQAIESAAEEVGITGVAEIQSVTPIKTSTLKRSYTFEKAKQGTYKVRVIFGTSIHYAPYVEFKNPARGGRPHFRSALQQFTPSAIKILEKHLRKVGK